MKHYVLSLVETDEQAQEIIRGLTRAGVSREDISILNSRQGTADDFSGHKQTKEQGRWSGSEGAVACLPALDRHSSSPRALSSSPAAL
jgi:hypothetical protein